MHTQLLKKGPRPSSKEDNSKIANVLKSSSHKPLGHFHPYLTQGRLLQTSEKNYQHLEFFPRTSGPTWYKASTRRGIKFI